VLAGLSAEDRRVLEPSLKRIILPVQQVLIRPNARLAYVYFIDEGVASVLALAEHGRAAEVGTIGNEGLVGAYAVIGGDTMPTECIMQVAGRGRRIPLAVLRDAAATSPSLLWAIGKYVHAFSVLAMQSAACNALHGLNERLARWLLMTHDRMRVNDDLPLTHELLGLMLGATRPSVSVAALALQKGGLIRYRQGHIKVLNRAALEDASCECYGITKRFFDDLLTASSDRER
jgi:CRP-like cAMP-binding protein